MKNTLPVLLLLASTALAGPPMVCHPYAELKDPPAERDLAQRLDGEGETLIRMEILRQALVAAGKDAGRVVQAMNNRSMAVIGAKGKEDPAREFDAAFVQTACCFQGGRPSDSCRLSRAVEAVDDAAAWLALARACTPLMRTGTPREHAVAFVRAYTKTLAMPEGPARDRMRKVLEEDLRTIEYFVDPDLDAPAEVLLGIQGAGLSVPAGEEIQSRLSKVEGVLKVDVNPKAAQVRLTREPGKAPLKVLNEALKGTPWTLGSAETTADRFQRLKDLVSIK